MVTKQCAHCGADFTTTHKRQRFCSKVCSGTANARRGNANPNWKGGRFTIATGYVIVNVAPNKWRAEHRVLMERHLGRPLERREHVHHINGDRGDNRIENLCVVGLDEHCSLHHQSDNPPGPTPVGVSERVCLHCGVTFTAPGGKVGAKHPGFFCSRDCFRAYHAARRIHYVCPRCGKPFSRPPSQFAKVVCCSQECAVAMRQRQQGNPGDHVPSSIRRCIGGRPRPQ